MSRRIWSSSWTAKLSSKSELACRSRRISFSSWTATSSCESSSNRGTFSVRGLTKLTCLDKFLVSTHLRSGDVILGCFVRSCGVSSKRAAGIMIKSRSSQLYIAKFYHALRCYEEGDLITYQILSHIIVDYIIRWLVSFSASSQDMLVKWTPTDHTFPAEFPDLFNKNWQFQPKITFNN